MGGAMALHLACRYHQDVAGVFALSSFLNKDSVIYQVSMPFGHFYQSFSKAANVFLYQTKPENSCQIQKSFGKTDFPQNSKRKIQLPHVQTNSSSIYTAAFLLSSLNS